MRVLERLGDVVDPQHAMPAALLVGLGWDVQLIEGPIPADPWDVPLDGFASPSRLTMFR